MIKQEQRELNLVDSVRQLYYNSNFEDCIQFVNENCSKKLFNDYQIAQLYKSICYFEQGLYQQGFQCFDNLFETISQNRTQNQKIDDLEVIIRAFHQWQTFFYNQDSSVTINENLKKILDCYKEQNENSSNYNIGAYQFGLGTYQMVLDQNCEDLSVGRNLIIQAKDNLKEFEQDIIPLISWTYYLENKSQEALDCINELFAVNPKFPQILNYIAIYQNRLHLYDEAEKNYLQIISQFPTNIIFLDNIAQFYLKRYYLEKAREYVEKAYEIDPTNPYSSSLYGQILEQIGDHQLARQIILKGIEDNPDYTQLYLLLSRMEYFNQNFEGYVKNLEKCVDINPKECLYQIYHGIGLSNIGQYQLSNSILNSALELKSSISNKNIIFFQIGYNHKKQQQFYQALQFLLMGLDFNIPSSLQNRQISMSRDLLQGDKIKQADKIVLLNQFNTYFSWKIGPLIQGITNQEIKLTLLQKQQVYQQFMMILPYIKEVQPFLSFQKNISHWDLFLD